MAVRYDFLSLASGRDEYGECEMGNLETLLERNEEDPVDAFERERNARIYEHQGNRNPFIDHQEAAYAIFGQDIATA